MKWRVVVTFDPSDATYDAEVVGLPVYATGKTEAEAVGHAKRLIGQHLKALETLRTGRGPMSRVVKVEA